MKKFAILTGSFSMLVLVTGLLYMGAISMLKEPLILTANDMKFVTITTINDGPLKITIPDNWRKVDRKCMACHVGYKITVVGPNAFDGWYIVDAYGEWQKNKEDSGYSPITITEVQDDGKLKIYDNKWYE